MRRLAPLLLAASLPLVLAACGGGGDAGKPAGASAGGPPAGAPPVSVETVVLQPEPLSAGLRTVGTLRADEQVVVRPEIAGRITAIRFDEGARVAAGAPLFALDPSVLRAALDEAEATLGKTQRAAARAQELMQRQLVARSDVDALRAELGVTEARVASAKAQLAKTTIVAPFAGVLGLREVSVGEFVNPGQALVTLVRLDPIELDFSLPESELARVAPGQPVRVTVDAFGGRTFEGTIGAIDPVVDVASRSARLRAVLPNPGHALRPGLFARVEIGSSDGAREALLLPEQALLQQGDTRYVYRVVAGKAQRAEVKTGRRVPGKIEVLEGLAAGDEVVVAGQSKPMMFDGASVSVAGAAPTPPSAAPAGDAAGERGAASVTARSGDADAQDG